MSKWKGAESLTDCCNSAASLLASAPSGTNTMPGLVQNWPAPSVNEACRPAGKAFGALPQRAGQNENGIGAAHLRIKRNGFRARGGDVHQVRPASREPVKPPAFTSGCCINAVPMRLPPPNRARKLPPANCISRTAFRTA